MRFFLVTLLLTSLLGAETIDTLIERALAKHDSLKVIEQRLNAMDDYLDKSRNFANPELSLGINDIQFDDPLNRAIEPMQTTSLNVKQKFPWFGKRDALTEKTSAQKALLFESLEAAQVDLAKRIRLSVYTINELRAHLNVLAEYEKLTRQTIELNTAYTSTQGGRHMGIMSAELTLSQIKIRVEKLNAALQGEKARLAYLVQGEIGEVTGDEHPICPPNKSDIETKLENNRAYRVKRAQTDVALAESGVRERQGNADPYVKFGYYYREAHPDYVSVTVGAALPIYGSEHDDTEAARKEALAAGSAAADFRAQLDRDFEQAWAELTRAWRVYRIIHNESLPQIAHMFELSGAKVRSGGELFAYIDLLEQKLKLDEQLVSAKADYLRAQAKLKALTGEIK
jgi:cobalt-zinc-cadmium efflux system outer membrane protein